MSTQSGIDAKVLKLEVNMDRLDEIVNAADTVDVDIDSGTVPSISKFQKAVQDTVDAIDADVLANKDLAETAAADAATSESNASTSATEASASETAAETAETGAETAQTLSEEARDNALNALLQYEGNSTTSVAIGTGSKSFTVETLKLFSVGMNLLIASDADATNYMNGLVTSYNVVSGELVVNVLTTGGSGTLADWSVFLTGRDGETGPAGAGDLLAANNLSDVADAPTALTNLGLTTQAKQLVDDTSFSAMRTTLGAGDVVGPASATDNALVRFDATTGKLVQNSGVTIDDSNIIYFPSALRIGADAAANELDDYEEGTWTPIFQAATPGTPTYTTQVGHYTKVGNKVFIQGRIIISSLGAMAGNAFIQNLPFTAHNVTDGQASVYIGSTYSISVTAGNSINGNIAPNTAQINLTIWSQTTGNANMIASDLGASANMMFSAVYTVA